MNHRNIITGETTLPTQLNGRQNVTWENSREELIAAGWRVEPPVPELAAGYTRQSITFVEGDGVTGAWQVVDRLTAEIEQEQAAATAAAEAARLATPIVQDQTMLFTGSAGVALPSTDGKAYQPVFDPVSGEWVGAPRTGSPFHPDPEFVVDRDATLAERQQHRTRMAAIKTDLDQVEAALDQVDVTTTGPLGVAIAATAGVNKTALQEVRKVLVDLKAAAKNLRQASEKVRREIR